MIGARNKAWVKALTEDLLNDQKHADDRNKKAIGMNDLEYHHWWYHRDKTFFYVQTAQDVDKNEIARKAWKELCNCCDNVLENDHIASTKFDKNHMGTANCHVYSLGFVLILWDLIRGTKNGRSTLTMTDHSLISHFHHDIIHQVQCFISPMMARTFNNAEPHHPSRTTSSFRALWEVSSGVSAGIHRKPTKI